VYPSAQTCVTLKSRHAITVWQAVTQSEPRVPKPKRLKIPAVDKPCLQCGLNLAKKKFCSGACRQMAYRERALSPVHLKERQAREQAREEARLAISNAQYKSQAHSRNGMEFDARLSEVGPSNWTARLTLKDKEAQIYPLERSLKFALESVQEKLST
jgi:hypothetical protein